MHFLEDTGTTLNTLDDSDFNIIISNTQKIIVKKKHTPDSAGAKLFSMSKSDGQMSIIGEALAEIYGQDNLSPDDLIFNQRYKKLCRLKQIGVYVDEAHHLFGKELEKEIRGKSETSLRTTINLLANELKRNGTAVVACYNYTGTPYVKNKILPDVVYSYGLKKAISNQYLKRAEYLQGAENFKSEDFIRNSIIDFWNRYGENTYEGLPAKMAIFAAKIEELTDEVLPVVEKVCDELGIPRESILVNVEDTSSEDIRDFKNLDVMGTAGSKKRFILLVGKGKEGWNCRSLFAVAMFRSPKSKVFILQATMRCLRQITDKQQEASVYLSLENLEILKEELSKNFNMTIDDLGNSDAKNTKPYEVRVLPPPKYITLKMIRHKYILTEKEYTEPVNFGLAEMDYTNYQARIHEMRGLTDNATVNITNADNLRETKKFSKIMLVAEIAKYLNKKCTVISRILDECIDGTELILQKVNLYNDILYDVIIPTIFNALYSETVEKITEDKQVILLRKPKDKEYYTFNAKSELVVRYDDTKPAYRDRSFHADTYCFDSQPEMKCFWQYIKAFDKVKKIFFTGMFTANQGDLSIPYYDPETQRMRNYYPDFLAEMQDGTIQLIEVKGDNKIDDVIVKAKAVAAEEIASESKMKYIIYAGSTLMNENVLEPNKI